MGNVVLMITFHCRRKKVKLGLRRLLGRKRERKIFYGAEIRAGVNGSRGGTAAECVMRMMTVCTAVYSSR